MKNSILGALLAAALVCSLAGHAAAQADQIRLGVQPGMSYLPFYVMEHDKLLEKRLGEAKLPTSVTWKRFANAPAMNDGLLSGSLDIVATGIPGLLTIWSKGRGANEIRGLAAYGSVPTLLVTRNPNVKTFADFTDEDRIAVPATKNSLQALLIEIECQKVFGPSNWSKYDKLTVSRSHPDATVALLSGKSEITAHFGATPYYVQELKDPAVHTVITAEQITGHPISNGVLFLKASFYEANRASVKQFLAALNDAFAIIKQRPKEAAEMYADLSGDKTSIDDIVAIITAPGSTYEAAPHSIKVFADFMAGVGLINHAPAKWSDIFVDEVRDLPGD